MTQAGLRPAPEADRRQWLRRVTYDLIGLPPTPEEMAAFLQDARPDALAYADVVDRLLASPHYGERWARHWLDVVRYADTDGFAIDAERPRLWRYRDYVIRHFNQDRPYGWFVRQQIAGDELNMGSEGLVATSFYRLGPYEADNMTPENRRQDFLNEITTTIGTAFLGITVGCARCHDHKYDPIPQADFYRLQAFIQAVSRGKEPAEFLPDELSGDLVARKAAAAAEHQKRQDAFNAHREMLRQILADALKVSVSDVPKDVFAKALRGEAIPLMVAQASTNETEGAASAPPAVSTFQFSSEQRETLEKLKEAVEEHVEAERLEPLVDTIQVRRWRGANPKTFVLLNGDPFAPGEFVQPGCLTAVEPWSTELQEQIAASATDSKGRRRLLAEWIASPQNPLTMRVYVNRVWQYHFGSGIVQTANDFGENGSGASHPELLDYLTQWFIQQGESTKPLHKLIVLSRTYRSSSVHPNWEQCASIDPDNRLLWRAPLRRLEAEVVRDALLAVSGRLNTQRGGPGFYEILPEGTPTEYAFFQWHASAEDQRCRRSIYMYQRRNLVHPFMESFDVAEASQSCERRMNSVTASQALTLLNGQLAADASLHLARRLQQECGSNPQAQLQRLFALALARSPTAEEIEEAAAFLGSKTQRYTASSSDEPPEHPADLLAWRDLCLVTLNSSEFLYVE